MRKCIVQKYGGSSVADIDKIKYIAEKISKVKAEGNDVVVVVSAIGKTTNQLIEMAKQISSNPHKRELDMLLSTGERTTMALLCIALHELGIKSVSLTGSQAGIITNDRYNDAKVIEVRPFRVEDELARGKVVVVGGFQGVSYKRDITTLGRGGSDTTAVALAAALNAERCEIYSDVPGVFTADPSLIPEAVHLPEISYEMMQEMSLAGAKVLNAAAVQFAKNAGIAIYARSTFDPEKETIIRNLDSAIKMKAVSCDKNIVRLISKNSDIDKSFNTIIEFLKSEGITTNEIQYFNGSHFSAILSYSNMHGWSKLKSRLVSQFPELTIEDNFCTLSLISDELTSEMLLTEAVNLLKENNIAYYGISLTSAKLNVFLERADLEKGTKLFHKNWVET